MKSSKLILICLLFTLITALGCSSFDMGDQDNPPEQNIKNRYEIERVISNEAQIDRYDNKQNILEGEIEREIRHITMDLLAKLKVYNTNESIMVTPVTLAEQIPFNFHQVREHIVSLFMNELFDFGFSVIPYQKEINISDLTLDTHISQYQGSYIINVYIKNRASGYIQSTAKSTLAKNLVEKLEDGVRVLR